MRRSWLLILSILFFFVFAWASKFSVIHNLDSTILENVHSLEEPFWKYAFVPFALTGSVEFSVGGLFLFSAWFYRKRNYKKAYLILAALLILTAIEFVMKQMIHHPEVPYAYRGRFPHVNGFGMIEIDTNYSFPSGHALRTMLLFGVPFVWFVSRRYIFLAVAVVFFTLQLLAMNYYGFHWPSDIIGGYWLSLMALYLIYQLGQL